MIYNLLIATIFIVAFFMCKILIDKIIQQYQYQIIDITDQYNEVKLLNGKYLADIELLRRESLDSYRKGLFDGIEISNNRTLNTIDSSPVKTIDERKENIEATKEEIRQQHYSKEQINEWLNGGD